MHVAMVSWSTKLWPSLGTAMLRNSLSRRKPCIPNCSKPTRLLLVFGLSFFAGQATQSAIPPAAPSRAQTASIYSRPWKHLFAGRCPAPRPGLGSTVDFKPKEVAEIHEAPRPGE